MVWDLLNLSFEHFNNFKQIFFNELGPYFTFWSNTPIIPWCYIRQCLTSSDSLLNQLVKGLVHTYIIFDLS